MSETWECEVARSAAGTSCRRFGRRFFIRLALGVGATGLAACGQAPAPAAKPAPSPTAAAKPAATQPATAPAPKPTASAAQQAPAKQQLVKWRHAIVTPKADCCYQVMGNEKGYYKDLGIDVEFVYIDADPTIRKALIAGELESGASSGAGTFEAIEKGAEIKTVASDLPRMPHLVMTKKDINSLADLYGRRLSVSAPRDIFTVQYGALFEKYNLDISKVEYVVTGGSGVAFQALIAGKVDAISSSMEFSREIKPEHDAKVLLAVGQELPDLLRSVIATRNDVVKSQRDALVRFIAGFTKGYRHAVANKDESVAVSSRISKLSPEIVAWTFDQYRDLKLTNPGLTITPSAIDFTQQANVKSDAQSKVLPANQLYDATIVPDATKLIGA